MSRKLIDESEQTGKLIVLFGQTKMNDEDVNYLCSRSWCYQIKELHLRRNNISLIGFYCLSQKNWSKLLNLSLGGSYIGDKGCKYLSRIKANKIKRIWLDHCFIANAGIFHLSKVPWDTIELLNLQGNSFSGQNMRLITKIPLQKKELTLNITTQRLRHMNFILLLQEIENIKIFMNKSALFTASDKSMFEKLIRERFITGVIII